jgi:hypothetical protein
MLTKEQKLKGKFRWEDSHKRLDEENGVVSLWIGNSDSETALIEYLEEDYSHVESDFEGFTEDEHPRDFSYAINKFGLDFGFGSYDHDFSACEFFESTKSLDKIVSYMYFLPSIKQHFVELYGNKLDKEYNTAIFLIDYRYVPDAEYSPPFDPNRKVTLKFIGVVAYDEDLSHLNIE